MQKCILYYYVKYTRTASWVYMYIFAVTDKQIALELVVIHLIYNKRFFFLSLIINMKKKKIA